MKKRVLIACVLLLWLFSLLFFGGVYLLINMALVAWIATYEVAHVSAIKDYRPHTLPAYIFALGFPFVYYYLGSQYLILFFIIMILASMIGLVIRRPAEPNASIISVYFFVYPLLFCVLALLCFVGFESGVTVTSRLFGIILAPLVDTFALLGGMAFGKHKLCPLISPKKTVEGAVSGLVSGIVFSVVMIPCQQIWGGALPAYVLIVLGVIVSIVSQFGDLFASMFKRWAGVKDFSSLLPEHGGLMDRLDSVFFGSSATYVVLKLFFLLN